MNKFIEDTEKAIKDSGHSTDDIEFIGDVTRHVTLGNWNKFTEDIQRGYKQKEENGYRSLDVCGDLIIAFTDYSLLYRSDAAGYSEWKFLPSRQSCNYTSRYFNAEKIVTSDGGFISIRETKVASQIIDYREQVRKDLGL